MTFEYHRRVNLLGFALIAAVLAAAIGCPTDSGGENGNGDEEAERRVKPKHEHCTDLPDYEESNLPRKLALLVGVTDYAHKDYPDLQGPGNDVGLMKHILHTRYEFKAKNIHVLAAGEDCAPTRNNVKQEFFRLAETARKGLARDA